MSDRSLFGDKTPLRIGCSVPSLDLGRELLESLTEDRLVSGGTVIEAHSVNWVGGKIQGEQRIVVTAYTSAGTLSLVRDRITFFFPDDTPTLSQYVLTDSPKAVEGWIERNVR